MLFEEKIVNYFLSYKISQDHVEMFFALIRRMNGFTNNPTTIQFRSAYKKLLLNNINVSVPASANCTPQDKTLMITDESDLSVESSVTEEHSEKQSNPKKLSKMKSKTSIPAKKCSFPVEMYLHNHFSLLDHDYTQSNWLQSEYLEDIVRHTAGFIVHSIKKKSIVPNA